MYGVTLLSISSVEAPRLKFTVDANPLGLGASMLIWGRTYALEGNEILFSLSLQLVESGNELAQSKEEFRNTVDQLKHDVSELNEQLRQQASTQTELMNENARMQAAVQR